MLGSINSQTELCKLLLQTSLRQNMAHVAFEELLASTRLCVEYLRYVLLQSDNHLRNGVHAECTLKQCH